MPSDATFTAHDESFDGDYDATELMLQGAGPSGRHASWTAGQELMADDGEGRSVQVDGG